jgi:hypothetical protein
VEFHKQVYYGEIKSKFSPSGNNYNLEIVSFGWPKDGWFGIEPDPKICATFLLKDLEIVQIILCQSVRIWYDLEKRERPSFLNESSQSRFMGEVLFSNGWALVMDEGLIS